MSDARAILAAIIFTSGRDHSHAAGVIRTSVFAALTFFAMATAGRGQEQEGKLMSRLLKPDMALQNGAESKKFVATGSLVSKAAPTKIFQFIGRSFARSFGGVRTVQPQEFHTTTSRLPRDANLYTRNVAPELRTTYRTSNYGGPTVAHDSAKAVETGNYSEDQRRFLVRGKSQKSLSAQDRPMTIDEVRELLNKNK